MSYFFVDKAIFNHDLFADDEYSQRDAWLWLICNARWKEKDQLKRGQLSFSIRFMAEKWRWSRSKTQRYIDRLKNDGMIETDTAKSVGQKRDKNEPVFGTNFGTGKLVITICNYEKYQKYNLESGTEIGTDTDTTLIKKRDKEEEYKLKTKESNNGDSEKVEKYFADWYEQYPRKDGSKTTARKKYIAALESGATARELWDGLQHYITHCENSRTEKKFIAHAATWLHQRRWEAEYGDEGFEHRDPYAVRCL